MTLRQSAKQSVQEQLQCASLTAREDFEYALFLSRMSEVVRCPPLEAVIPLAFLSAVFPTPSLLSSV